MTDTPVVPENDAVPSDIKGMSGKKISAATAASRDDSPPSGMIEVDGQLRLRRRGFLRYHSLKCWNKHQLHAKPGERPIETVMVCGHCDERHPIPCEARLYVLRIRSPVYFAMDVTATEHDVIEVQGMQLLDIIEWFSISFR